MRRRGEKFAGREVGGFPAQQTRVPAAFNLARLRILPALNPCASGVGSPVFAAAEALQVTTVTALSVELLQRIILTGPFPHLLLFQMRGRECLISFQKRKLFF